MTDTTINEISTAPVCVNRKEFMKILAVDSTPLTRSHASLGRGLKLEGGY